MFSELIFVILAISVLLLIDNFSTIFSLISCILLVYGYVYNFPYILNKRVVVLVITKIWGVLLYCFRVGKQVVCLFQKHILFVKTNDPPPSHSSIQFCGNVARLENEINVLVLNISRHYIRSWYDKISPNEEFSIYLNSSINHTLVNLCQSISKFDKKKFSYIILHVYLNFFSHFVEAKKKSDIFKKENLEIKHWAMRDNLAEMCYLQSLVSTLLDFFSPSECDRSLRSKHSPLLHTLVVEILTKNIIHPIVNKLCNPEFINKIILKVLLNFMLKDEEKNISPDNCQLSVNTSTVEESSVSQPVILLPNEELSDDQVFQSFSETQTPNRLSIPCESFQIKEGSPELSIKTPSFEGTSDDFPCFVSSGIKSCSNLNLSNHDFVDSQILDYDSHTSVHETTIKRSRSADFIRQMPQLKALNEKDYNIVLQSETNKMLVALKSDLNSNTSIEQAEEAIEIEVPTLFTDVKIVDTFQQNEAGLLPYTLYCIQYTGIFHDTGKSSDVPHFVKQIVNIKRRFREFVALQSMLEDNPSLKAHLKGIKGPSKWLVLPFSNLDKRNIAERRVFLENYLRELCSSAAISQSSELQEFLAYGGEDRMAFVRKSIDASVPRIDKILVRGVRGAFDMFRTALPNSPLEEENSPRLLFEDPVPDQRFQEHLLDYSSREPEIKEHVRNFMENSSFRHTSDDVSCFEHSSKKSSLLRNTNFKIIESCQCSVLNANNFYQEENPLGNTLIELLAVALQLDESNLGYMFSVFKILSAPFINRFLVHTLDSISQEHLTIVLHSLHKFLWPEDKVLKEQSVILERELAFNKIMDCFEVLLDEKGVMLLKVFSLKNTLLEKINLFLSSIQCEEANRCLLFHMFDVVIETLCSEET